MARVSLFGRNLTANLVGTAVITLLTAVITPMQVHILGIEAFGIVTFITTLQMAFTAFDFGLSSTLTRELAADTSDGKLNSRPLVATAVTIYWLAAILVGAVLVWQAAPIANAWLRAETLTPELVAQSLRVTAVYLALRWPVALYSGLLTGFQRLDILNMTRVAMVTLRMLGGIAVLLVWRTLDAFLWWTAFSALLEVMAFDIICRRVFPAMPRRPRIDGDAIRKVWRFSVSMNAIAVLAVLIVQMDRLFISKMLPLQDLGFYNLAYTLAAGISLIIAAVSSAVLPSLAEAHGRGDGELSARLLKADRALLFLAGGAAFAFIAEGKLLLTLWVNATAAAAAYPALAVLSLGFWFSALNANSYNVAVASGRPGRFLQLNLWLILPYMALLYVLIDRFGIIGAAGSWVVLNLVYAGVLIPFVHREIMGDSVVDWLASIVLPFTVIGAVSFFAVGFGVKALVDSNSTMAGMSALLVSSGAYVGACYYWFINRARTGSII
jgi:O-antigen/teichoic acid export membrane protein